MRARANQTNFFAVKSDPSRIFGDTWASEKKQTFIPGSMTQSILLMSQDLKRDQISTPGKQVPFFPLPRASFLWNQVGFPGQTFLYKKITLLRQEPWLHIDWKIISEIDAL